MIEIADGHTTSHMKVNWKRGFDKSDVTENNSISLAQVDFLKFSKILPSLMTSYKIKTYIKLVFSRPV